MAFEQVKNRQGAGHIPAVTISKELRLFLNAAAVRIASKNARHVEIYFDPAKRIAGLKFLTEPTRTSYTVTNGRGTSGGRQISCNRFFRDYDVPLRRLKRELTRDEKNDLWTFKVPTQ